MEVLKRISESALLLASRLYAGVVAVDRSTRRTQKLPFPTISVGNIALGGRAKTPMCIEICKRLKERGFSPVVLTRGYGRIDKRALWLRAPNFSPGKIEILDLSKNEVLSTSMDQASLAGDEALEIFESGGVNVLVGADRAGAAKTYLRIQAIERPAAVSRTVFVLDDGFQHWSLQRDLDIVLIRSEDLSGRVIPSGRLREHPQSLDRAHLVFQLGVDVFKRCHFPASLFSDERKDEELLILTTRAPDPDFSVELDRTLGARPFKLLALSDHADATKMRAALKGFRGTVLLGGKEYVKLSSDKDLRMERLTLNLEFSDQGARLDRALNKVLGPRS